MSKLLPLGDLVDIVQGCPFDSSLFGDEGNLPVVRIRDVVPGFSRTFLQGRCDPRYIVRNGDVLIGMDGEFNRGRWQGGEAALNQRVCKIAPSTPALDESYLFHFLPHELKAIEARTSFATVKHISAKQIRKISVPLPPLPEQRRIAAILDQADALRAKRRAALAQLDEMAQAIFVDMFGSEDCILSKWPSKALSSLVSAGDSINYGVIQPGDDYPGGIPLVRVGDLLGGQVAHAKLKHIDPIVEAAYKRSRLRGDEILVSCVGSIGTVALTTSAERGFNIARAVARVRVDGQVRRKFIAAYLRTSTVQNYFERELRTVSQPTLNIKQIGETVVPVPPIQDQDRFVSRSDAVEGLRNTMVRSQAASETLFASLQHRAFRGEL